MNSASGPIAQYVRRTLAVAAVSLSGFGALHAQTAYAAAQNFDIPAQNTSDALNEFSRQSGLRILFSFDAVSGQTVGAIRGSYAPEEVLRKLLAGSELTYEISPDAVVLIRDKRETRTGGLDHPHAQAGVEKGGESKSINLAQADTTAAGELEEVVVTSKVFKQNDAFGATKVSLSLKDTPQTVLVVTQDLIDASGMERLSDLYKVDASSGATHEPGTYQFNFYRGFRVQGSQAVRVDGFRMPGWVTLDFATFDRFEVIKGATSTLYGQNSIGGMLNLVSKLPQRKFAAELGLEGGEFNAHRLDADVTGSLGGSEAWSYRLIGAYSRADTFLDFGFIDLNLLSASIQYEPSETTRFMLRATWQDMGAQQNAGPTFQLAGHGTGSLLERVLNEGLKIADLPRSRNLGMPWTRQDAEVTYVQFQGEHAFANDWRLRGHAQYSQASTVNNAFHGHGPLDENGFAYSAHAYGGETDNDLYGAEINLFGKVALFGRDHTLFFGVDYSRIGTNSRYGYGSAPYSSFGYANSILNAFHPDYTIAPPFDIHDYANLYDADDETELYGATVQLILNPVDRVKVLLGGRYSVDTQLLRERGGGQGSIDDQGFATTRDVDFHNFTMQTGVTYALTDAVNLYASYGETFEPKTGRVFVATGVPGKLIDPEEGTSYEIGAKADLSKDLSFTMAVFQMERTNISQSDPLHPGFSLPLGTQQSRGVELGAQGRLAPPLSVFASVAYLDGEFSEGEFKGLQVAGAPRFGVSVFGSYEILEGGLKGLGFGLGTVYKTGMKTFDETATRAAGVPFMFDSGSFTEVDARVFYGRNRWNATLSVTNLFDEKYYSIFHNSFIGGSGGPGVNPPRTIRASVRYRF